MALKGFNGACGLAARALVESSIEDSSLLKIFKEFSRLKFIFRFLEFRFDMQIKIIESLY